MPPGVLTVTSTVPADAAGEVAVIWVDELTATLVELVAPKLTTEAAVRLVPVMTTEVPPTRGPVTGDRPVTVGMPT